MRVLRTTLTILVLTAAAIHAQPPATEADPFADLTEAAAPQPAHTSGWVQKLFGENFGFRKEIMSQFDANEHGQPASRQSIGFEALKKFSTGNATIASFD